jgi:hypothetical protein
MLERESMIDGPARMDIEVSERSYADMAVPGRDADVR